jgi:hypothetical protein
LQAEAKGRESKKAARTSLLLVYDHSIEFKGRYLTPVIYSKIELGRCSKFYTISHVSGTKKMEYKTRQWHEKCFCCVVCKNPIGTKSFIPREQEIYCAGCYEDKFATRCVKCNKVSRPRIRCCYHINARNRIETCSEIPSLT